MRVGALLIHMVPLGLAAALSPVPIIVSVTLSASRRPVISVSAYSLGGLLAYVVVGAIGITLINQSSQWGSANHPSTLALIVGTVIGCFLLAMAVFALITRSRPAGTPRWMKLVQGFGPGRAFLTGIVILSPHLKNLLLLAAALTAIGSAQVGPIGGAIAILVFMAITLSPVLAPLIVHLTHPPDRALEITGRWKGALERNSQTILATVFVVMGLKLVEQGLAGLLS